MDATPELSTSQKTLSSPTSELSGPTESYCTLLDNALSEAYRAESGKPMTMSPLRPSSAGYCTRKIGYEMAAYNGLIDRTAEDRKPSIIRLLSLGHGIEYHALRHLQTIPGFSIKFKQQVVTMFKLASGRIIEGSLDAVMWSDDHKGVLDVKSVGNGWSSGYKSRWEENLAKYDRMQTLQKFDKNAYWIPDPEAFFEEVGEDSLVQNITQVNLYLCTDFLQERGVDHGVIYRYSKVDSQHAEFRFPPSFSLFEKIRKKFEAIDAAASLSIEAVESLPRDYNLGSMACAYCPYAAPCWGGEVDTKKTYYRTLPKKNWAERLEHLEGQETIDKLFAEMAELEMSEERLEIVRQKIIKELQAHDVNKIKLQTGEVFEVKLLQSPKPHLELRRGKE